MLAQQRQVVRAVRLHQLVGQPGVEQPAGDGDAMPAQRRDPALQVVPYLGDAVVLPELRQLGQHGGGALALLRQRQEGGRAFPAGQRHPGQRTGLGVAGSGNHEHAHRIALQQIATQLGARGLVFHQHVVVLAVVQRAQLAAIRTGRSRGGGGSRRGVPEDALDQCVELEFLEHRDHPLGIQLRRGQVDRLHLQLHVAVDGGQALGQQRLLGEGLDLLALLALELSGCRHQLLHRAEAVDQLLRGLLPHPRDAGDVVHAVAGQADQVDHLLRLRHAEPLAHSGHVVDQRRVAAHAGQPVEKGVLADQLREVLVERDHVGVEAGRLGTPGDRADHVVRLHAGVADDGDAHRLGHAVHVRQRVAHPFRSLGAGALVVGVLLRPPGGAGGIEHHRDVGGLLVGEDLQQRRGVAEHCG